MAIPASDLVQIVPRVLTGTGQDLVFNGLMFSENARLPASQIVTFYSPDDVADYFGESSDEYIAAAVYFAGYNNSLDKPRSLLMCRVNIASNTDGIPGFTRGTVPAKLSEIRALGSTATLIIERGAVKTVTIDVSDVTSYSGLAETIQTAINASSVGDNPSTVTYSPLNGGGFTVTQNAIDQNVVISGGTLAPLLGFGDGAVVSPAATYPTLAAALNKAVELSQNFVTFAYLGTLPQANAVSLVEGVIEWLQARFAKGQQYLYVHQVGSIADLTGDVMTAINEADPDGVTAVYGGIKYAAFIMGAAASIAWNNRNSTITFAYKAQSGLAANVTVESEASTLTNSRVNFMGYYATRNDNFILLQPGACFGQFKWIDTYLNATWLNSALQTQIMAGFAVSPRVPYTEAGYTLIRAWVQDVADRAIYNGVIDTGVELSATQKSALQREAGRDISTELYNSGYYLMIETPTAAVRQNRESPACNFWYTYGGSVHKINLPSTAIV